MFVRFIYIDGSCAVSRISLTFQRVPNEEIRLIGGVSVYFQDQRICHMTLLYKYLKDVYTFYRDMWCRPLPEQNCQSPQNCHMRIILGCGKNQSSKGRSLILSQFFFPSLSMAILKQIITTKTDQCLNDQNYKAIGNFLKLDALINLADDYCKGVRFSFTVLRCRNKIKFPIQDIFHN